jgi:hypothetical protein
VIPDGQLESAGSRRATQARHDVARRAPIDDVSTDKPPVPLEPDGRWQSMVGTHADLAAHAATWPTHPKTNEQVVDMLAICRRLFEHTYFVYEFGVVAIVWSVLAVEAALRDRLGEVASDRDGLAKLIGKAEGRGWFKPHEAEALRAGAELRNRLVHAQTYGVFTPGMVAGALETAHLSIARLYASD